MCSHLTVKQEALAKKKSVPGVTYTCGWRDEEAMWLLCTSARDCT